MKCKLINVRKGEQAAVVLSGGNPRYVDIGEGDELDEARMANWVKQAAALPGFLGPRP